VVNFEEQNLVQMFLQCHCNFNCMPYPHGCWGWQVSVPLSAYSCPHWVITTSTKCLSLAKVITWLSLPALTWT
jgi:hypothetical protein